MKQIGPWLQMAIFCDGYAVDEHGRHSYVQVHDGIRVKPGAGAIHTPHIVLAFTGGGATTATLRIVAHIIGKKPEEAIQPKTLRFDGPGFGTNLISMLSIPIEQEGTHWFDVLLNGVLLTRMPFRVYAESW